MSCPSITAICEELIMLGSTILDPVTITSSTSSTSESWAKAKGTDKETIAKALNKYLFKLTI